MIPGAAIILTAVAITVPGFFVLMWVVGGYNRLVGLRNRCQDAYAQIQPHLKRRYDLIPELVESAKGYLLNERGALEAVLAARNEASAASLRAARSPGDVTVMKELSAAEAALAANLRRFFALANGYPEFRANATVAGLTRDLTCAKAEVDVARQTFNDAVMSYNTVRETFPTGLIAGPFSFGPAETLVLEKNGEQEVPNAAAA